MPELPEVEVICQGLEPLIIDREIIDLAVSGYPLRLPIPETEIRQQIVGRRVAKASRRAKYILIHMDNNALLVLHLGMSGKIGLFPQKEKKRRHDHLQLRLDNHMELRLNDTRRFGSVQVFSASTLENLDPFAKLGPEPFGRRFTASYLQKMAGTRQQPVKNFLMDGRVVVGIGNIYASEILFASRIKPHTPIFALNSAQWKKIVGETGRVLKRAIACGGTTIADFVNSRGEAGSFQVELKVYGRKNDPCPNCGGPIKRTLMAGRATFHCSACQE